VDFRSPSELVTGTPRRPAGCPARQTTLPLLDFCHPTTRSQTGGTVLDSGSLRRRVPRPGFGYPPRDIHHRSSRRLRAGASMGFTLQGFLLDRDRCPSRGPFPPAVTRLRLPPRGEANSASRLQGFALATSSCCHRNPKIPAVDPSWGSSFQSVLPFDPALAFIAAPPLSPSDGLTSRPAWASGYRGANESGDPSPDLQLS
jgi:hypothetical protein